MKLYYSPGACSLSPHIVLNEAGLPFEKIKADTKTKVLPDGGDYKNINPLGYVPLLELDDGTRITEGPAIVQYIADQAAAKNLAPANGSPERRKLQELLTFLNGELHKNFSPLFNPTFSDEVKGFFRDRLTGKFKYLDAQLAGHDYLMGTQFTVADGYLFTMLRWADAHKLDLSAFKNLMAYKDRVAARPKVQEALEKEGLMKAA